MKTPNDPMRLLNESSESSDALRKLLRSSKMIDDPSEARVGGVALRLAPLMIAPPPVTSLPPPPPVIPSIAPPGAAIAGGMAKALVAAKVGVAVIALACAGGGGAWYVHAHSAASTVTDPPALASAPAPSPSDAASAIATPAPPSDPPAVSTTKAPRAPDPAVSPSASDRIAESRLATSAQEALAAHDDARALSLAREHRTRFPKGAHAEERDRIAIEALSRLGQRSEARAAADHFFERYPNSIYRARIEALVAP